MIHFTEDSVQPRLKVKTDDPNQLTPEDTPEMVTICGETITKDEKSFGISDFWLAHHLRAVRAIEDPEGICQKCCEIVDKIDNPPCPPIRVLYRAYDRQKKASCYCRHYHPTSAWGCHKVKPSARQTMKTSFDASKWYQMPYPPPEKKHVPNLEPDNDEGEV